MQKPWILRFPLEIFLFFILSIPLFSQDLPDYNKIVLTSEKKDGSLYITTHFYIMRDLDFVWDFYSNPRRLSEVYDDYDHIEILSETANPEGRILDISYEIHLPVVRNMKYTVRQTITPKNRISWFRISGDLRKNEGVYTFEAIDGGVKVRFISLFESDSYILNKLGNLLIRRKTRESVEDVKEYLERFPYSQSDK